MTFSFMPLLDWIALTWFLLCWIGYTYFARIKQRNSSTIANQLEANRVEWLERMIQREMRMADISGLGILQRNVTFFASTTIFIIAGLLTVLGSTEKAIVLLQALPWIEIDSRATWELKILILVVTFAYAFFKFTWSMRQYNFAIVLFGSAPDSEDPAKDRDIFIRHTNWLLSRASNSFNYGLRAYTFALATLGWFFNPVVFMIASTLVVGVLYRREFRSATLAALYNASHHSNEKTLSAD
ncbi:DUF599 domain-containing protein [Kangiella geojedonensis]|uniref:DUF599 domain-containing protein n=1 Tax=Kangiella geojedonensis TaxID=914150 RepID=A0A0F6TNU9_9GAMM|nr:DUF599 domain-containing protein [Kangiella geojedonensis]AKE51097.1 hypothetical protein TQ33_0105 [Kangiella geojedonensis]